MKLTWLFPPHCYLHFPQAHLLNNNLSLPFGLWSFLCFYPLFISICHFGKRIILRWKQLRWCRYKKISALPVCLKAGHTMAKVNPPLSIRMDRKVNLCRELWTLISTKGTYVTNRAKTSPFLSLVSTVHHP